MSSCPTCREYEANDPNDSSVETLLGRISLAARTQRLLLVDVAWQGCSGCANFELGEALFSDHVRLNSLDAKVPWKAGADVDLPTKPEFTLFTEMVRGHRQRFGHDTIVESYPVPPWDRPHFPQIFFIDPRAINTASLERLCELHQSGDLFNCDDELNFGNVEVRIAVYRTFPHGAVLLQLLNEHLFAVPNDDFQGTDFFATFDCVVDQFRRQAPDPESCFRYLRPSDQPRGEYNRTSSQIGA